MRISVATGCNKTNAGGVNLHKVPSIMKDYTTICVNVIVIGVVEQVTITIRFQISS